MAAAVDHGIEYGKIFGSWQIRELIGSGSKGRTKVYRITKDAQGGMEAGEERALKAVTVCEDADLEKMTAQAKAEYDANRDFLCEKARSEVLLMKRLEGASHIVGYLDWEIRDRTGGTDLLIAMHLLETLEAIQKRRDVFREEEVLQVGMDICEALVWCQKEGIIHRDIKPANIFRRPDGRGGYLLGDFGVSRIVDNGMGASTDIGTPAYAAPEQVRSAGGYHSQVDIYSLGVVLYELSNRSRLPFAGSRYSTREIIERRVISGEALPAPTDASPAMASVILKACAFRPEDRFQTAQEFFDALAGIKAHAQPADAGIAIPASLEDPYATVPLEQFAPAVPPVCQPAAGPISPEEPLAKCQPDDAHAKSERGAPFEEGRPFDKKLNELMTKASVVRDSSQEEAATPLQRIIEEKLSRRYWEHISGHTIPPKESEHREADSENLDNGGKHFTVSAPKGMKYVGYCICSNRYDFDTLTTAFSVEILEQTEKFLEDGSCNVTFYVDNSDPNGDKIILFGIDQQEGIIYGSHGVLIGNRVIMNRDLLLIKKYNISSLLSPNSSAAYISVEETRDYLEDTTLDGAAIIIDLSTCTPVLREVYYDGASAGKKARIHLKHNNAYFVFRFAADEPRGMTDIEIGECYEFGISGFPRDIMKAVQYYEKSDPKIGYYRIAELFKSDPILNDEQFSFEYMLKAAKAGSRTAMLELSEMMKNGVGCFADQAEAERWRQESERIADESPEMMEFEGNDIIFDGGILYTD